MGYGRRGTANPNEPATENRVNYIRDLLVKRDLPDTLKAGIQAELAKGMTNATASSFIGLLLARPQLPGAESDKVTKEGEYLMSDGRVAVVRRSPRGLYAGIKGDRQYIKGLIFQVKASTRIPTAVDQMFGDAAQVSAQEAEIARLRAQIASMQSA